MSYVVTDDKDPHPGRCLNYRYGGIVDWQPVQLRCLDYENRKHVCVFPDPPKPRYNRFGGSISTTYPRPEPDPWVKPGDDARNGEDGSASS